ncbi:hypothetical protein C8J56DRAFT_888206 [Mycena floridula]|nr:hypothetical protein C8J56DRAFT_888206 [Mycena floridula]
MPSLIKRAFLRKHSETRGSNAGPSSWRLVRQLKFKLCQFDLLGMLNTKALDAKGQKRRRTNQRGLIRHQQLPLRLTEAITKTHPDHCSSYAEADPTCRWCCLRMSSSIALPCIVACSRCCIFRNALCDSIIPFYK